MKRRLEQSEHVVVVTRDALATMPQLAAMIEPPAEPMQNHHLVPEGTLRLYRCDASDR
jgi:hypothetical protein